MWQHRWALWSGLLGATASCLAKIAFSTTGTSISTISTSKNPMQWLQVTYCEPWLLETDLDAIVFKAVYRVLGDLMIHHGINVMRPFQILRHHFEDVVLYFNIFEVHWCQVVITVGPRLFCSVAMLLMNAYMIACFLKGMQCSGSVVGTAISSAANFSMSAIYGYWFWQERFPTTWWIGFSCVIGGVLLLSTIKSSELSELSSSESTSSTKQQPQQQQQQQQPRPPTIRPPSLYKLTPKKTSAGLRQYGASPSPSKTARTKMAFFSSSSKPSTTTTTNNNNNNNNASLKKKQLTTMLVDRTFANECALCEAQLFDESTGQSQNMSIADLSPNCFHVMHAKCLKGQQQHQHQHQHQHQQQQHQQGGTTTGSPSPSPSSSNKSTCPVCDKSIHMWISAKQAAHFAGFWMDRVETCLQQLGPGQMDGVGVGADAGHPIRVSVPASQVRQLLQQDETLTDVQKQYIDDDPTGLGKGLESALEWGGSVDYNNANTQKGHVGWSQCLLTRGVWNFDVKKDELWLWEWGVPHPKQRCDQCQFLKRPLAIACKGCEGSSEQAYYCTEACQKRDWQRHKMTCQLWQREGPKKKTLK